MQCPWSRIVHVCLARSFVLAVAGVCFGALLALPIRAAEGSAGDGLLPLSPGDAVSLEVFGQPDMTTTVYVGKDGTIQVPLARAVQVAGLTAVEAAQRVEQALKDGQYLRDPHVTLSVTHSTSQQISVLGEVHHPGQYALSGATTLLDILAQAGGLTDDSADLIYILRTNSDGTVSRYPIDVKALTGRDAQASAQPLKSGDAIMVPTAQRFYIDGEVNKPDKYRLDDGMTVLQAITLAGGVTAKGSERRVEIRRMGKDGRYVIKHAKGSDLVQADDVIRVKESIF